MEGKGKVDDHRQVGEVIYNGEAAMEVNIRSRADQFGLLCDSSESSTSTFTFRRGDDSQGWSSAGITSADHHLQRADEDSVRGDVAMTAK